MAQKAGKEEASAAIGWRKEAGEQSIGNKISDKDGFWGEELARIAGWDVN